MRRDIFDELYRRHNDKPNQQQPDNQHRYPVTLFISHIFHKAFFLNFNGKQHGRAAEARLLKEIRPEPRKGERWRFL